MPPYGYHVPFTCADEMLRTLKQTRPRTFRYAAMSC
jgi:hypothetical protein